MAGYHNVPDWRRVSTRSGRGSNPGPCGSCSAKVGWRSVNNRCWRCEQDHMRHRRPFYIEYDILVSAGKTKD